MIKAKLFTYIFLLFCSASALAYSPRIYTEPYPDQETNPLGFAAFYGDLEGVKKLIAEGADVDTFKIKQQHHVGDFYTPLEFAVFMNNSICDSHYCSGRNANSRDIKNLDIDNLIEIIHLLVNSGAQIKKSSLLNLAISSEIERHPDYTRVIETILQIYSEKNIKIDQNILFKVLKKFNKDNPVHIKITHLLIKNGVDFNPQELANHFLFDYTINHNLLGIQFLVNNGVDINEKIRFNFTALDFLGLNKELLNPESQLSKEINEETLSLFTGQQLEAQRQRKESDLYKMISHLKEQTRDIYNKILEKEEMLSDLYLTFAINDTSSNLAKYYLESRKETIEKIKLLEKEIETRKKEIKEFKKESDANNDAYSKIQNRPTTINDRTQPLDGTGFLTQKAEPIDEVILEKELELKKLVKAIKKEMDSIYQEIPKNKEDFIKTKSSTIKKIERYFKSLSFQSRAEELSTLAFNVHDLIFQKEQLEKELALTNQSLQQDNNSEGLIFYSLPEETVKITEEDTKKSLKSYLREVANLESNLSRKKHHLLELTETFEEDYMYELEDTEEEKKESSEKLTMLDAIYDSISDLVKLKEAIENQSRDLKSLANELWKEELEQDRKQRVEQKRNELEKSPESVILYHRNKQTIEFLKSLGAKRTIPLDINNVIHLEIANYYPYVFCCSVVNPYHVYTYIHNGLDINGKDKYNLRPLNYQYEKNKANEDNDYHSDNLNIRNLESYGAILTDNLHPDIFTIVSFIEFYNDISSFLENPHANYHLLGF